LAPLLLAVMAVEHQTILYPGIYGIVDLVDDVKEQKPWEIVK
jgi:hypothetical protein